MCLSIEHKFIKVDYIGGRKYKIVVLERLCEPEALDKVSLTGNN